MTTSRPPPIPQLDYDAVIERLIDTMTCLVSLEQDFQAARLNLETISCVLFEALSDHPNEDLRAKHMRLMEKW